MVRYFFVLVIASAVLTGQVADAQEKFKPVISGPYRVLFRPSRYGDTINDHTVFADKYGEWRMIGILSRRLNLLNTPAFAHGVGSSLDVEMRELPPLFGSYPDRDRKWAPHVIVEKGVYHLYAGPGKIRHYASGDGVNWTFQKIVIRSDWANLRDTMVMKIADGEWLMYVTDRDNSISIFESGDLESWTRRGAAFHAIKPAPVYPRFIDISACESPFVIYYKGYYYLSTCLTNSFRFKSYSNTVIVRSADPRNFGVYAQGGYGQTSDYVTTLDAHAAEYIQDHDGNWHITSAGWRSPTPKGATKGALNIAPLKWEKE